jgi:hypothetical protein
MSARHRPPPPGHLLLRIARLVLGDAMVASVIEPAVADFQHEFRHAGGPVTRLLARLRGYLSFWTLLAIVRCWPGSFLRRDADAARTVPDPDRDTILIVTALCVPLVAIGYTVFGSLVLMAVSAGVIAALGMHAWRRRQAGAVPARQSHDPLESLFVATPAPEHAAGVLFVAGVVVLFVAAWTSWLALVLVAASAFVAIGSHAWHDRHPATIAARRGPPRHPEINFAGIQVMENMAGLLVVVGGVSIMAAGLPAFRAFLLATVLAGCAVAAGLCAWRLSHPTRLSVENSIAPH